MECIIKNVDGKEPFGFHGRISKKLLIQLQINHHPQKQTALGPVWQAKSADKCSQVDKKGTQNFEDCNYSHQKFVSAKQVAMSVWAFLKIFLKEEIMRKKSTQRWR